MASRQVMAFDLGASNGRAIVGDYDGEKVTLHEVHRFSNEPVQLGKHLYWDFPRLYHELIVGLTNAKKAGYNVESIGVDTWGVDYGLIDPSGQLLGNPIHYRDQRAAEGMAMLLKRYDAGAFKKRTGMDCVSYNTINQLINESYLERGISVDCMLNMPDLFNYFLTGNQTSEYSMASTTQLYDYASGDWHWSLIEELSLPKAIFKTIVPSGTVVGEVKNEILNAHHLNPLKVVSVTSHDTASAASAVATDEEDYLFIATGTWIIVGTTQNQVTMNDQVMTYELTNEGGKYPGVNLLKNHVGLWILQETKRAWNKKGNDIGFGEMVAQAREASIDAYIDIKDSRFFEPGHMPDKIMNYLRETNQPLPKTIGETVLVIEKSLAKEISETLSHIEEAVGKTYKQIHIFGGGVQDTLLCDLIGQYSKKKVVVGVKEATAFGNVLDQLEALEIIGDTDRERILQASVS